MTKPGLLEHVCVLLSRLDLSAVEPWAEESDLLEQSPKLHPSLARL